MQWNGTWFKYKLHGVSHVSGPFNMLQSYFPKLNACQSAQQQKGEWQEKEEVKEELAEVVAGNGNASRAACQLHLLNDISYQRNCRETDLEQIALSPPLLSCMYGKPHTYTRTRTHTHAHTLRKHPNKRRRNSKDETIHSIPFHLHTGNQ